MGYYVRYRTTTGTAHTHQKTNKQNPHMHQKNHFLSFDVLLKQRTWLPGLFPCTASKIRPLQCPSAWMEFPQESGAQRSFSSKHNNIVIYTTAPAPSLLTPYSCRVLRFGQRRRHAIPFACAFARLEHTRGEVQKGNVGACHTVVCVWRRQASYEGMQDAQTKGKDVQLARPRCACKVHFLFLEGCNTLVAHRS